MTEKVKNVKMFLLKGTIPVKCKLFFINKDNQQSNKQPEKVKKILDDIEKIDFSNEKVEIKSNWFGKVIKSFPSEESDLFKKKIVAFNALFKNKNTKN